MGRREVKFDLRTKLMLILVVNLFLLLSHALAFELVLVFGCLLLITIDGQTRSAFHYLIAFCVMLGIDQLLTPYISGFAFTLQRRAEEGGPQKGGRARPHGGAGGNRVHLYGL